MVTTLMVALAAGLFALSSPSKYVSTANILVGPVTADVDTLRASELLTSTYSQVLVSPEAVAEAAGTVGMTPKAVTKAAGVTFNTETRIVTLSVTTTSDAASRQIATSLTGQLTQRVGTVDPTSPGALSILSVQPQTAEELPRSFLRYAALGGVGWLLLAAGVLAALGARPGSVLRGSGSGGTRPSTGAPTTPLSRQDVDSIAERVESKVLASLDDRASVRR